MMHLRKKNKIMHKKKFFSFTLSHFFLSISLTSLLRTLNLFIREEDEEILEKRKSDCDLILRAYKILVSPFFSNGIFEFFASFFYFFCC